MQVGSIGDVVFEVSSSRVLTPESVSFSDGASYEEHKVIGAFPVSEYVAPELRTCHLTITLRRSMGCDPKEEAEHLVDLCLDGEVVQLVVAGENMGPYTIRKVDQDWRHSSRSETGPSSLTLTLELKEYW